jgi:hypothetical protein
VPPFIQRGVNLEGSTYQSERLLSSLAAILLDGFFEQPARS